MQIEILMFAGAAQLAGASTLTVTVPQGASVADVAAAVRSKCPHLSSLLTASRWAVARQFVPLETTLHGGEEVALIPPVSGG